MSLLDKNKMSETEIIKLKKKINLVNEYNTELKSQLEEQSLKIGELQNKYNLLSMKYKSINNQNLLGKDKDNIQKIIEASLSEEKDKNKNLEKSNKLLLEKISLYEQMLNQKEDYIIKLVNENSSLKRDFINSSKNIGENNYSNLKNLQKENEILNNDKKTLVEEFNIMKEQMEDIIRENRVLRQMADVPENFGIDLTKVKIGEKIKIEDYKSKIRLLNHYIDELETERAQIKHNIYFLASSFQLDEQPFNLLSKEQKVELAFYAKKLYEQKGNKKEDIDICQKCLELNKIIEEKDKYIKKLEEKSYEQKEFKHQRFNSSTDISSITNKNKRYENLEEDINSNNNQDSISNEQINELKNLLRQSKDEIKKAINNKQNNMNNRGNVYNFFQYNNNFLLNQNNMESNNINEKKIFKRGYQNNK